MAFGGVIGPPWRAVPELSALALSIDPPTLVACDAVAAFCPLTHRLQRCKSMEEAQARATILAAEGDGTAHVLKGALLLESGTWYFPLRKHHVEVTKALDPLNRKDRAKIADTLARSLRGPSRTSEAKMLSDAVDTLDIDWTNASDVERDAVIAEIEAAAATIPDAARVRAGVRRSETLSVGLARNSRRSGALNIRSSLSATDRAMARRIASDNLFFMKGDYGRRAASWKEREALRIIASGASRGLDDRAIAADLHKKLRKRITNRTEHYYRILANATVVRSSSLGQLSGMRDAGIELMEWSAVMDEATCNVCAFLHGKTFPVSTGLGQFERAQATPDPESGLFGEMPWYREFEGNIHVGASTRGGPLGPIVANVLESGVGVANFVGNIVQVADPATAGGTLTPPAHGMCRCLTLPKF